MDESLKKRIEILEAEVSGLKTAVERQKATKDWQSTVGRFRDSKHYDEAARLGGVWRKRQHNDGGSSAGSGHGSLERARSSERGRRKLAT